MPMLHFITSVFCLIDDLYKELFPTSVRRSGPPPELSDSETITMEIVGEWAGKHNDTEVWNYFDQHWRLLFPPDLSSRSRFVNQSANLWHVREKIQQRLIQLMHADNADIHLIDGFPIEVCLRTRARNSKIFKGETV